MADVLWIGDATGALGTNGNWSDGTVPDGSDNAIMGYAVLSDVTGGSTFNAVALPQLRIEPGFRVKFGASGDIIRIGTMGASGRVEIEAPLAPEIWIGTESCGSFVVRDCGEGNDACVVAETCTNLFILGGGHVRVAAAATVTTVHCIGGYGTHPTPKVTLENGATITNVLCYGGVVNCSADVATLIECSKNGTVNMLGSNSLTPTTIRALNGGTVNIKCPGTGILNALGGRIDMRSDPGSRIWTAATAEASAGGVIDARTRTMTWSAAPVVNFGRILGGPSTTVINGELYMQGA